MNDRSESCGCGNMLIITHMFLSAVLCYENNEYIEYKEYIEDIK